MSKSIKLKNNVYLDDISLRRNIIFCNPSADVTIPANSYTTIDNLSAYSKLPFFFSSDLSFLSFFKLKY